MPALDLPFSQFVIAGTDWDILLKMYTELSTRILLGSSFLLVVSMPRSGVKQSNHRQRTKAQTTWTYETFVSARNSLNLLYIFSFVNFDTFHVMNNVIRKMLIYD